MYQQSENKDLQRRLSILEQENIKLRALKESQEKSAIKEGSNHSDDSVIIEPYTSINSAKNTSRSIQDEESDVKKSYGNFLMRSSVLRNEIQTLDQEIKSLHQNLDNAIVKKSYE